MAIHLGNVAAEFAKKGGEECCRQGVNAAKGFAPKRSGKLAASIHSYQTSPSSWLVTTAASGSNGFAYPARIEFGEPVVPTGKYTFHGVPAIWYEDEWHPGGARATEQPEFMKKAMQSIHI